MFAEFAEIAEMHTDTVATQQRLWKKVGENLLALSQSMESCDQVKAFLQVGMTSGKPSVAISMDVMIEYMTKNGITPGFAVRDNISE